MLNSIISNWQLLFDVQLIPRAFCLSWNPILLGMSIFGNTLTLIAYLLIPLQLLRIYHSVKNRPLYLTRNRPVLFLFFIFILFCSIGHQIDIVVLWFPWYWIQSICICATGIIGIAAAFMMPYLVLPSETAQLEHNDA